MLLRRFCLRRSGGFALGAFKVSCMSLYRPCVSPLLPCNTNSQDLCMCMERGAMQKLSQLVQLHKSLAVM